MDRIYFTINGKQLSAGSELPADTTLNEYIRNHAELRGTKYMCKEGGCGACIVNVRVAHPITEEIVSLSVNSCLVLIMSCDNWDITTVEGIGNRKDGHHIIQKRLNHYFGSQCGYCSPGFVMSMYSLMQNNIHVTEKRVEESLDSNLCRCTGYRPILEAFKSLAIDASQKTLEKIRDIEDIDQHVCPLGQLTNKCDKDLHDWCLVNIKEKNKQKSIKKVELSDGRVYFKAMDINTIFKVFREFGTESYMLVGGNTAKGVKPLLSYPKILIDVSNIKELKVHFIDQNLVLGANITLSETLDIFEELSKSREDDFWYLAKLNYHIQRVAHTSVRNFGTLAGNLVLKNNNPDFQSDIFLLLDCVGAAVTVEDHTRKEEQLSMESFLKTDLTGKVLTQIKLPPLSKDYKLVTYKVTPRQQNAQAEVNAAFLLKFDNKSYHVLDASIVYGGIDSFFTHAFKTENYLRGKYIFHNHELQNALYCLEAEINPTENPPNPSPNHRKRLAIHLFYKCILKLCPSNIIDEFYESGSTSTREDRPPVSHSYQEYDTNDKDYPITQPLLKKEGMVQCSGEAVYVDDMPARKDEVFASFVLASVGKADIQSIDATDAMKIHGVIAVLTSADIPGENNIVRVGFILYTEKEELLASNKVRYYNQPVAIVVAKTQSIADLATNFVQVNYKNITKTPLRLTIDDAIKAPSEENRLVSYPGIIPTDRGKTIDKVVKGVFYTPSQYHFTTELHSAIAIPIDEGFEVHVSTQFMDMVQATIAQMLKIPENLVTVITRRCGGAFGCKISRTNFAACAVALVAKNLNKPCRMAMSMPKTMRSLGKRCSSKLVYEVGVNIEGEIQYMDAVFYINDGISSNENINSYAISSIKNCYDPSRWKVDTYAVHSDIPSNCFMRAPGAFEGISAIEHIMDQIAHELKKDPVSVRMANYRKQDNTLPKLIPMFKKKIDFEERQKHIAEFNHHNRWKKRGLNINNMSFPLEYLGNYGALVAVYHGDGSVIVTIGGIEIGQGIFTRIAQVAANEFKIPVETVTVTACYNFASPNNFLTGSSITTQCSAYSVIKACEQIKERLAPFRAAMPEATWQEIVFAADLQGINLQANYLTSPNDPRLVPYSIFGIAATEVEIDVLTGEKWIVRADVFEDVGRTINPALDIGQVEGAFIQSLSAWTVEEIIINRITGELYTDRTWNYKVFGAKDVPNDYRIYLQRNTYNPVGILGSKAVSEPPICLGHVIVSSIREAIKSSRRESGYNEDYFCLDVPATNENVLKAIETKIEEMLLY